MLDVDSIELKAVMFAIKEAYGLDFSEYTPELIEKKMSTFIQKNDISSYPELMHACLVNPKVANKLVYSFLTNYTELFRDPDSFQFVRKKIIPTLATEPVIRIWSAGCSSGEEIFSLAILLTETDLYEKAILYATDINRTAIKKAELGKFCADKFDLYEKNYISSGGNYTLGKYVTKSHGYYHYNENLKANIIFSSHDLVSDVGFNEFSLISCKNVLIYFNESLKYKVLNKLIENLKPLGYLTIGKDEAWSICRNHLEIDALDYKGFYRRNGCKNE